MSTDAGTRKLSMAELTKDRGRALRRRRRGAVPARRRVGRADLQPSCGTRCATSPSADRARCRCRRSGRHPRQHARSSSRSPTWRRRRPGPSSCPCTRRTRRTSASGSSATPAPRSSSARTPPRSPRSTRSAPGSPDLEHTIIIDGEADGAMSMADVAAQRRGRRRRPSSTGGSAAVGPDDACLIIYTSGTTGRPKGVVLTNKGFAAGRRSAVEMALFGQGDVVYLYLPLAHVFAQLDPGRLHRGRRGDRLLGRRHDADRRRARRGQADRAAVGAADLREGLQRGDEHGPAGWRGGRRRGPSPSG